MTFIFKYLLIWINLVHDVVIGEQKLIWLNRWLLCFVELLDQSMTTDHLVWKNTLLFPLFHYVLKKFIFIIHWHAVLYNDVLIIEISILSPLWLNWIKFQSVFFFFGYFTNFLILFERKGITGSIMVICCSAWLVNRTAWPNCSNLYFVCLITSLFLLFLNI